MCCLHQPLFIEMQKNHIILYSVLHLSYHDSLLSNYTVKTYIKNNNIFAFNSQSENSNKTLLLLRFLSVKTNLPRQNGQ